MMERPISEYKKLESIESNMKMELKESNTKTRKTLTSEVFVSKREELDDHPLKTGIVIERSDFLYLERQDEDGNIFYEEILPRCGTVDSAHR